MTMEAHLMINALHLVWIIPLAAFIGYAACGLLTMNNR